MLTIFIINCLVTGIVILIHYEALLQLSIYLPYLKIAHRFRIAFGLIGALLAHLIEIWVFGVVYHLLILDGTFGTIEFGDELKLMDNIYFSLVTYTSLGYGDMVPTGLLRFTAGLEGLVGLVLIAMTASFIYMQMEKFWSKESD